MPKIELVAIDLDGTLLNSNQELSAENIAAVKACTEMGVRVIIASARNPDVVGDIAGKLGIQNPMICSNGAQVWGSPSGPIWAYHPLSQDIALTLAQVADENGWLLSTTIGDMIYWRQNDGQPLGLHQENIMISKTNAESITDAPIQMFAFQQTAIAALHELCGTKFAGECEATIFYKRDGAIHSLAIVSRQASKGAALDLVCGRLGIQSENVMAIGDNLNDLSMFEFAGISVAMGNSLPTIQAKATAVAPDNDHSGVSWALEKFVINPISG